MLLNFSEMYIRLRSCWESRRNFHFAETHHFWIDLWNLHSH